MRVKDRPQCYFDVELNREPVGRIVFQLFSDVCPRTSKNFLSLCTGERGTGKVTGKKLCYKGSTFHRVVKNFMIQGGDFTEGTGRGGESIYGGYFKDENFTLKHDRPFLLSMANRGKDTNGSQFFITTKKAPHLDGVHVVFGLIISGFEVITKIEGLKTDSASRPYADVRVVDCGQLITKSANDVLEGKRKRSSLHSDDFSPRSSPLGEHESDETLKQPKKKKSAKIKPPKKKRKVVKKKIVDVQASKQRAASNETEEDEAEEKEQGGKREKPVVRPEEIPPVPENRFLLRRDMPSQEIATEVLENEEAAPSADQKPAVSKSGRKIRGRGTIRYHTPTRSKSRSVSVEERGSSETPPHWKEEMKRTKNYRPPSTERWSKGDKLNDRSSSRWDDRSDSTWSQSGERSSDRSSKRSSPHRQPKKEKKKVKQKKKAKKHKHGKKNNSKKSQELHKSEGERSGSSERKSRRSCSETRSPSCPHNSPPRKRQRSSMSFSRSYSRSYTSSRSRSGGRRRSYSRSRSRSRSRSPSDSRSRSRSYSPSQSRSRSRSRYKSRSGSFSHSRSRSRSQHRSRLKSRSSSRERSLSRSPRKRKTSKPKPDVLKNVPEKRPETKIALVPKVPAAPVPERVPVIPLSDSPPPSRWKPGQKPWKPSYIHISEIKAKVAPSGSSAAAPAVEVASEKTVVTPKSITEDSRGDKEHMSSHRSHSRSSRSKSYSRSRSRSSSRSRSRSSHRYESRSSSHNRSDSENDQKTSSSVKTLLDKEWKDYYSSLKRIQNMDKYISLSNAEDGLSGMEKGTGSEKGPDISSPSEKIKERSSSQEPENKHLGSHSVENLNSWSEWDSDSEQVGQGPSATSESQKQEALSGQVLDKRSSGWNSDSESEKVTSRTVAASEKEEGEASSESEPENLTKTPDKYVSYTTTAAVSSSSVSLSGSPEKEPDKHKSKKKVKRKKKHKRRSEGKSSSHHNKDKAKKAKRKHQKLRETFHWQPPLEEEEEEDAAKRERRSPVGENPSREEERSQLRSKETKYTKHSDPHQQALPFSVPEQESLEDMDICTPEHNVDIFEAPITQEFSNNASDLILNPTSRSSETATDHRVLLQSREVSALTSSSSAEPQGEAAKAAISFKWRPLKGTPASRNVNAPHVAIKNAQAQESQTLNTHVVRMEIKSKSRVRPGSLFDEVRKTARLNQRPRNQESSSEEESPSVGKTGNASHTRSPKQSRSQTRKSHSVSSQGSRSRGWSRSSSRSRSRSRSYTYSSRSRSRSRRRHRRRRSRSSTYRSYSRTYSRSPSRSRSYGRHRRSRSDSYDSYSSRSVSRRRGRSDSYRSSERRSRSYRSSSRSSSRRRSHSRSSRYS
uniref:peptidylprolyl isomerase n=1 Tax=Nothobranchius kuhntae TaxID=321403 RepID=A0A1A8J8D9_NOTKU